MDNQHRDHVQTYNEEQMNNGLERAANRERLNKLGKLRFETLFTLVKLPSINIFTLLCSEKNEIPDIWAAIN